jgi:hypothetical protein
MRPALRHDRTLNLKMSVTPVIRILRVATSLIGDPDAAGEADFSIDDQHLAMSAVVEPISSSNCGSATRYRCRTWCWIFFSDVRKLMMIIATMSVTTTLIVTINQGGTLDLPGAMRQPLCG